MVMLIPKMTAPSNCAMLNISPSRKWLMTMVMNSSAMPSMAACMPPIFFIPRNRVSREANVTRVNKNSGSRSAAGGQLAVKDQVKRHRHCAHGQQGVKRHRGSRNFIEHALVEGDVQRIERRGTDASDLGCAST